MCARAAAVLNAKVMWVISGRNVPGSVFDTVNTQNLLSKSPRGAKKSPTQLKSRICVHCPLKLL